MADMYYKTKLPTELAFSPMYESQMPIKQAKINDLFKLLPFLKEANQEFYRTHSSIDPGNNADVDNSDNSSGEE